MDAIRFTLNGNEVSYSGSGSDRLLEVLRDTYHILPHFPLPCYFYFLAWWTTSYIKEMSKYRVLLLFLRDLFLQGINTLWRN